MKTSTLFQALICMVLFQGALLSSDPGARQAEHLNMLQGMNPQDVNDFRTDSPSEASHYGNGQSLDQAVSRQAGVNAQAQILLESAHKRPFFAIDPVKDPLVTFAEESVTNPEKVIREAGETVYEPPEYEEKVCEESKPTFQVNCTETLKVATSTQKQRIYLYSIRKYSPYGDTSTWYTHEPGTAEYCYRDFDGCNWSLDSRVHVYRYEVQELQFDARTGTSTAGPWREVDYATYLKAPNDEIRDEWVSTCAYLKAHEKTTGGQ